MVKMMKLFDTTMEVAAEARREKLLLTMLPISGKRLP